MNWELKQLEISCKITLLGRIDVFYAMRSISDDLIFLHQECQPWSEISSYPRLLDYLRHKLVYR